ncbi:hypothetical protein [Actinomyces sp. 432]|nr:hypothetical protein [Actinomyces sp. 432]
MTRPPSYKPRHRVERRRLVDVVRAALRLTTVEDKTAEEVVSR